jgi:hypothetical protein
MAKTPFDLEYLQKFYRHSALWIVCELDENLPKMPIIPVARGPELGKVWPFFASKGLAYRFIRKHGLQAYSPFELHEIHEFHSFVNAVSATDVTNVEIYNEKDKPQVYQAKDLLKKIEESLDRLE